MTFLPASLLAAGVVAVVGARFRSRAYALFAFVSLSLHASVAAAVLKLVSDAGLQGIVPWFLYLHVVVFVRTLMLIRPRMRPLWYRGLVSMPAAYFSASTLLALPWVLAVVVGLPLAFLAVPYALGLVGIVQSLSARREEVDLVVADGVKVEGLSRHSVSAFRASKPLRIVQITDPHLGPFMSVGRLRRIVKRAVQRRPDLVFLTGDFLTMESQGDPRLLADALAPLRELEVPVFACLGNHDYEALETVRSALEQVGAKLLVDEACIVDTPVGTVQVVGMEFSFRARRERTRAVLEMYPRQTGALRLVLLHDPGAFVDVPPGEADLVLSGHTHGGQVGLVSLGIPFTLLRLFMNAPDHGFWALGENRLYVHRGTGHYGFPLRLGVPAEESVLNIHAARAG